VLQAIALSAAAGFRWGVLVNASASAGFKVRRSYHAVGISAMRMRKGLARSRVLQALGPAWLAALAGRIAGLLPWRGE